jgi:hypothetical protein
MTNSTKNAGIRVKSAIRAAGFQPSNHNASVATNSTKSAGLRVKSAIRAAGFQPSNHNVSLIAAR